MTELLVGKGLIAQSGGPTAVINASLVGAIERARRSRSITSLLGSLNALEGCVRYVNGDKQSLVNLSEQSHETLSRVLNTPGAALLSSRKKVGKDIDPKDVLKYMVETGTRYFFYIGGNDSADNARLIKEEAEKANYDLAVIHIPKTIDNDLRENDHTPGFGSAARYVASAFIGDNLDNRSLRGVKINVVMGRNAGFLTAASSLGRESENDSPHLVYVPEIPFSRVIFLKDIARTFKSEGRAVIAVSEGIEDKNGTLIGWDGESKDSHGNPELDSLYLGKHLVSLVKKARITNRVRADVLGYIQRSFPLAVSEVDRQEARQVGIKAVEFALTGERAGSVVIRRKPGKVYEVSYELVPLEAVAKETRRMPRKFMNSLGNNVSQEFLDYARPLIGELPEIGELEELFVSD